MIPKIEYRKEFFDREYNSLIDLHSYGHDIETSWLIDRGVDVVDDPAYREKMTPITANTIRIRPRGNAALLLPLLFFAFAMRILLTVAPARS